MFICIIIGIAQILRIHNLLPNLEYGFYFERTNYMLLKEHPFQMEILVNNMLSPVSYYVSVVNHPFMLLANEGEPSD